MIAFTVIGQAQPAGTKRSFPFRRDGGTLGVRVTDANPKAAGWKREVALAAREVATGTALLAGPLVLEATFFRPRPKAHLGARGLRPSAPARPITSPDLLKTARALEDALKGVVYRDDAAIVEEHLSKHYGEPQRVEVTIRRLEAE